MTKIMPDIGEMWTHISTEHPEEFRRFQEWLTFVLGQSGCDIALFNLREMNTPISLVWGMVLSFFDEMAIKIHMDYVPKDRHFVGFVTQKRMTKSFYGANREEAQRATLIGAFKIFAERK